MAKHLIDVDEAALRDARAELGTRTIRDTVNLSLRLAGRARRERVVSALDRLAAADLDERERAWR